MTDTTIDQSEPGYPPLMRRDRLERIADAERDRRAGRIGVAIATIGEPVEWPARAVLALARLSASESEVRSLLEEGLDLWARDVGVGNLGGASDDRSFEADSSEAPLLDPPSPRFDSPLDVAELDRAFAEAEAEVDAMHGANEVAERVLMNEPVGFAEVSGDERVPAEESSHFDDMTPSDVLGLDAAYVETAPLDPAWNGDPDSIAETVGPSTETLSSHGMKPDVLATLEIWLHNIQRRREEGRAQ